MPLTSFHRLQRVITLEELRRRGSELRQIVDQLHRRYGERASLYFPFDVSGVRDLRLLQGYAFKLPRAFLDLFPALQPLDEALAPTLRTSPGAVGSVITPGDADATPFDPANITDARETIRRTIRVRRGQKRFRDALIAAYEGAVPLPIAPSWMYWRLHTSHPISVEIPTESPTGCCCELTFIRSWIAVC